MDALAAEVELVCNLPQRAAFGSHLANFFVSFQIGCRAGLERTPLPVGNLLQPGDPRWRKKIFAISLPDVSGPCTERNFIFLEFLNMCCGNSRISIFLNVLLESSYIEIEFCAVIHSSHINRTYVRLYSNPPKFSPFFIQKLFKNELRYPTVVDRMYT